MVTLARSWLSPAQIAAAGKGVTAQQYDPAQRAYVIHRDAGDASQPLTVTLSASHDSPLVNPALVVENWQGPASVRINGKPVSGKEHVRTGLSNNEGISSLIVWFKLEAESKTVIQLDPKPE